MTAEPPSLGATQVIVTLVFEFILLVGAAGTLGIVIKLIAAPLPAEE